jgi:predicted ATP-grasp superfamily ATP-dependent carboligase
MKVVLIGASVRPLIASCIAAGITPIAFDFFADWDSQQMLERCGLPGAKLTKIKRYEDLLQLRFDSLGDAVIFAGGAELVPDLVDHVSESIEVLGTSPSAISTISDPMNWLSFLHSQGFSVPESRRDLDGFENENWLRKKSGRCGGRGIERVGLGVESNEPEGDYFQKLIQGRSYSAQFVRSVKTDAAILLGCCRQIFYTAVPFQYAGSVFALKLPANVNKQIQELGSALARKFDLVGVWGLDFVLDETNTAWPVDLNPRITASTELFEGLVRTNSNATSTVDLQRTSCSGVELSFDTTKLQMAVEGKLILFNRSAGSIHIDGEQFTWLVGHCEFSFDRNGKRGVALADIPNLGQEICPGHPVLTIRGRAKDRSKLISQFRSLAAAVHAKFDIGLVDLNWTDYE